MKILYVVTLGVSSATRRLLWLSITITFLYMSGRFLVVYSVSKYSYSVSEYLHTTE